MTFNGYNFHRALRKHIDSTASVICWNAINLLDWSSFVELVNQKEGTLKERCLGNTEWWIGNYARCIFNTGLKMLDDEEWEILEQYSMVENDDDVTT